MNNGARVLLDGQPVLTHADWNLPANAYLALKLSPGKHELMAYQHPLPQFIRRRLRALFRQRDQRPDRGGL